MTLATSPRCSCGLRFTSNAVIAGRCVWYWCPACDGHGTGCADRNHEPGRCTYEAGR